MSDKLKIDNDKIENNNERHKYYNNFIMAASKSLLSSYWVVTKYRKSARSDNIYIRFIVMSFATSLEAISTSHIYKKKIFQLIAY